MSVSSHESDCIETHDYGHRASQNTLVECPLCGHQFDDYEPRWKHFLDEHDASDIPSPR